MADIRRMFGFVDDATAGGSSFDDLGAGAGGTELKAIPAPTTFWPVTSVGASKNNESLDRDAEARNRRERTSREPFREAPVLTVGALGYRTIMEKALRKTLGGADVVTGGPAPAALVHTLGLLNYGTGVALPAVNAMTVRDNQHERWSGCAFNRTTLNFPMDGYATMECELWALYKQLFAAAPPSESFTGLSPGPMLLRDAAAYFDPTTSPAAPGAITGTMLPDFQGFSVTFLNNLVRKFYGRRNVATQAIGTQTKKLWWPEENRMGAAVDFTFNLVFGSPNTAQELNAEYGIIQKLVFDILGYPLGTTPAATELLRITFYNVSLDGDGGAEALTARDDITASFDGAAYFSSADAAAVKVEFVNDLTAAIT